MTSIIVIIVAAGLLGGLTNFLNSKSTEDGWLLFWRCIVSGIAASFVVPLFLTTIQSSLLDQVPQSGPSGLVFGGFCLLAAFSSRAFLDSLAQKALRIAKETKEKTEKIDNKVEVLEEVADLKTEQSPKDLQPGSAKLEGPLAFGHEPIAVLKALLNPNYTFRTVEGIRAESRLQFEQVSSSLDYLKKNGLANQSERKNGVRWYATAKGRALLAAPIPSNLSSEPPK